tara:strand:+ start:390 stop:791 length:402 start_codon:yes stop_codon:yes gene_type:complete
LIKFIGHTIGSDLTLGLATLPTGMPVLIGSLAGMFDDNASDLHVNLAQNNLQLFDENMEVITSRSNSFYQELLEVVAGGKPIKPKLSEAQQVALDYLVETGWYVERYNDPSSGKEVPEAVLLMRAEARIVLSS